MATDQAVLAPPAPPVLVPMDYRPMLMRIAAITQETGDVKTFRLHFVDEAEGEGFSFRAGQFGLYSVFGAGEATFCIASSPTRKGYIECSVKRAGKVTSDLHDSDEGDIVGFRGPYGNSFPLDSMRGKNLLFIGGGIGLAPLRSLIWNCLDLRDQFREITILYGARTVADLVYKSELKAWRERQDVHTVYTVDPGGQTPEWDGKVGFVPNVLTEMKPFPEGTIVITCGPPIMIKFVLVSLAQLGFPTHAVYTTLENRMKCGIGKCGRCNVGGRYVCKDGPVFRCDELTRLPQEF
ncbi:MAG: heterodisulfide reductase subunit F [Planctomycetes bacterium]|nr:heterodisulfide reductase subunit F [Planctomycetota bacterium]